MIRNSLRFSSLLALGLVVPSVGCSDPCVDDGVSVGDCKAEDDGIPGNTETSSTNTSGVSLHLCRDADGDAFGNPAQCQSFTTPMTGWVDNDDDCDDTDPNTYPGAAEHEGSICAKDSDDDGWGDDMPKEGVTPGRDCDDTNANTYPGAAQHEADLCAKDEDDDDWGDNNPNDGVDPGLDCDDNDPTVTPSSPGGASCLDPLTVHAGDDQVISAGASANLAATAAGGSGFYAFAWTPVINLTSPDAAQTAASPSVATLYTVTVTDLVTHLTAQDDVNVSIDTVDINLQDDCKLWDLGTQNDALDPPVWEFTDGGRTACQLTNNNSSALLCPGKANYHLSGEMWVPALAGGPDNDWIGFLWNVNVERTDYFVFDWKQEWQVHDFCGLTNYPPGMRIKEISLPEADTVLTCNDLAAEFDTPHSKVVKHRTDITGGATPWLIGEHYRFEVDLQVGGAQLEIFDSKDVSIASTSFESDVLQGGDFGLFGFSQDHVCFTNVRVSG